MAKSEDVPAKVQPCCILNAHKARTDKVRLVDIANEFVSRNENRKRNFGTFTEADLFQTEKIQ